MFRFGMPFSPQYLGEFMVHFVALERLLELNSFYPIRKTSHSNLLLLVTLPLEKHCSSNIHRHISTKQISLVFVQMNFPYSCHFIDKANRDNKLVYSGKTEVQGVSLPPRDRQNLFSSTKFPHHFGLQISSSEVIIH